MILDNETQPERNTWERSHSINFLKTLERKENIRNTRKHHRKNSIPSVDRTISTASKTTEHSNSDASSREAATGIFETSIHTQRAISTAERKAFMIELANNSAKQKIEVESRDCDNVDARAVKPLMSRRAYFNQLYKYKMMKENEMNEIKSNSESSEESYDEDDVIDRAQCSIWGTGALASQRKKVVHKMPSSRLPEIEKMSINMSNKEKIEQAPRKKLVKFKDQDRSEQVEGPGNSLWNKSLLQIVGEGLFGGYDISPEELGNQFPISDILVQDFDDCSAVTLDAGLRLVSGSQK
jgi:hypothetical protein